MRGDVTSAIIALMMLAACSGEEPAVKAAEPLAVRVATIGGGTEVGAVELIGTAAWRIERPLGFTTAGQIAQIYVNEGDRVSQGQLLARLDTTPVEAELSAASGEQRRSRAEVERVAALYKQGWVTKSRLEAAEAAAATTSASVRGRRFSVDTARIVAPSSGIVLLRQAEPLQVVAAGAPVLVVGDASSGYVMRAPANDRIVAGIALGAPAQVRFEALGNEVLTGQVREIGGRANRGTGTFDIEIALPADDRLKSGMIGRALITASARPAAATIVAPSAAVLAPRAGEGLVYVIDRGNRARLRTVQLGEVSDAGTVITRGLARGDRVALSGFDDLREGLRVRPVFARR